MIPTPTTAEAMIIDMRRLAMQLQAILTTVMRLGETVAVYTGDPEDNWVRLHGEAVTIKRAAELIGRTPRTVSSMAANGVLGKTPDGNIIIRDLARWANSKTLKAARRAPRTKMAGG